MFLDHLGRAESQPLTKTDVFETVRFEDLQEFKSGVTCVLHVMSESRRYIANVARLIAKGPSVLVVCEQRHTALTFNEETPFILGWVPLQKK